MTLVGRSTRSCRGAGSKGSISTGLSGRAVMQGRIKVGSVVLPVDGIRVLAAAAGDEDEEEDRVSVLILFGHLSLVMIRAH